MRCISLFVLSLLVYSPVSALAQYRIDSKVAKRIEGVISFKARCPNLQAKEWLAFVAKLPETDGQRDCVTKVSLPTEHVKEKSVRQRDILQVKYAVPEKEEKAPFTFTVTYQATLMARQLRKLRSGEKPPTVMPLSASERNASLRSTGVYDFNTPTFKEWLKTNDLIHRDGESDLKFAYRAFQKLRKDFTYHLDPSQKPKATQICEAGKSDCGGLSIAFVSVMRANNIPARCLYGRFAFSAQPDEIRRGEKFFQFHVLSEFYADGVGWVPVDMALSIARDKSADGRESFGRQFGNFIAMQIDPEVVVDTIHFGDQTIAALQTPPFWVSGTGSTTPYEHSENWEVKTLR